MSGVYVILMRNWEYDDSNYQLTGGDQSNVGTPTKIFTSKSAAKEFCDKKNLAYFKDVNMGNHFGYNAEETLSACKALFKKHKLAVPEDRFGIDFTKYPDEIIIGLIEAGGLHTYIVVEVEDVDLTLSQSDQERFRTTK